MRHLIIGCCLLGSTLSSLSAAQPLEEMLVTARHDARTIDLADSLSPSPDPARLLGQMPGADINRNGPITGIPQYRGLFGPRIAVTLDGSQLAPAGPNWMDPPLSYAVTPQLEALEVYRGIAPVSVAQETLGGAIIARTRRLGFGDSERVQSQGRVAGTVQSVNQGLQLDAELQLANDRHRVRMAAMQQVGDDAAFPGGDIRPSSYERRRYDLGYGLRWGDHSLQFDYGYNDTGEAGTPALPMDIDYFQGDLGSLRYRYAPASGLNILAAIYGSVLDHGMTNYHLRQPPPQAMWRQNIATTDNLGLKLEASLDTGSQLWRWGVDGFSETHDSDIENPNNPVFFVANFNDARRDVLGMYLEHEREFAAPWRGEFGLRVNRVSTDADAVDGTPAMMMPPARALRDAFNAADRDRSETNVDAVAKLSYQLGDTIGLYLGLAQKQRGPGYQERYLWLPLEATAGLADGQVYVGNLELDSELARQLEFGLDYTGEQLRLQPRLFYYHIEDYIQGTPVADGSAAAGFVSMMNAMNGTMRSAPLQFNNGDAELYGFDMDWSWQLAGPLSLGGQFSYVRGKRRDIVDNLYRISPPNAALRLDYLAGPLRGSLEAVVYARQDEVSTTHREQATPGYAVVNLLGAWEVSRSLELSAGIENLLDRRHAPHLGGYNRAANPDVGLFERLPAEGINVFGRASYRF